MLGHLKSKCCKLSGYPPGHRLAKGKAPVAIDVSSVPHNTSSDKISSLSNVTITPGQYQQI